MAKILGLPAPTPHPHKTIGLGRFRNNYGQNSMLWGPLLIRASSPPPSPPPPHPSSYGWVLTIMVYKTFGLFANMGGEDDELCWGRLIVKSSSSLSVPLPLLLQAKRGGMGPPPQPFSGGWGSSVQSLGFGNIGAVLWIRIRIDLYSFSILDPCIRIQKREIIIITTKEMQGNSNFLVKSHSEKMEQKSNLSILMGVNYNYSS